MKIDEVRRSWVLNCCQLACFCKLKPDEMYEHVTPFLHVFLFRNSRLANMWLSKQSVLCLRDMAWFNGTAAAVNRNYFLNEMVNVSDKAVLQKNGQLVLSCFVLRRTDLLNEGFKV